MGQCSTLPTEARNDASEGSNYSKNRYRQGMTESSDNSATPLTRHQNQARPTGYHLQVQTEQQAAVQLPPRPQQAPVAPYGTSPYHHHQHHQQRQPMQEEREPAPAPPDCAVRQRCYKLNLESDYVGIYGASTPRSEGQCFGPFADGPPPLTYSGSEDSSDGYDPTNAAIQTAQIFRGITVAKDGTILSQNARATRSSRTSKTKRGEKSRQAAKIDQAKDLVEECVLTGKTNDKDAQMVSLIIAGEYDEMKQLVRDGSKKLRDANGLSDEALFAVNRIRGSHSLPPMLSPSRKRVSPFALGSPHSAGNNVLSPTSKARHQSNSAPPKLKVHPRDPSRRGMEDSRQNSRRGFPMNDPCNDMFGSSLGLTRGFNSIWNCGGNTGSGTMSSTQNTKEHYSNPASPQSRRPVMEGRQETNYRAMRNSERMEPPSGHEVYA